MKTAIAATVHRAIGSGYRAMSAWYVVLSTPHSRWITRASPPRRPPGGGGGRRARRPPPRPARAGGARAPTPPPPRGAGASGHVAEPPRIPLSAWAIERVLARNTRARSAAARLARGTARACGGGGGDPRSRRAEYGPPAPGWSPAAKGLAHAGRVVEPPPTPQDLAVPVSEAFIRAPR